MPEKGQYSIEFISGAAPRARLRAVIGIDLGATALKAVLVRKGKEGLVVADARLMPAVPLAGAADGKKAKISLPASWKAKYAAVGVSPRFAVIRYVTLHGRREVHTRLASELESHLAVEEDTRAAFVEVPHHRRESETNVLLVALPDDVADRALSLFATGSVAAASLEVSGVASVGAFMEWGPEMAGAIGFLDCGGSSSVLSLYNKANLCLMRKLPFGGDGVLAVLQQKMDIDADTAVKMLVDGSFDISSLVGEVTEDFIQQVKISCEFVERREDVRVEKFYFAGGLLLAPHLRRHLTAELGRPVELWNPFEAVTCGPGDWQERIKGQEPRFAAALGCAMGVLGGATR